MMRSTVERMRGSSRRMNPTRGSKRVEASRAVSPYDWVKAPSVELYPYVRTSARIWSRTPPAGEVGLQVQLLGRSNAAIERDPTHDLGIDEMTWLTAYLPDALVRFAPVGAHILDQRAHHLPHGAIERLTVPLKASLTPVAMDVI